MSEQPEHFLCWECEEYKVIATRKEMDGARCPKCGGKMVLDLGKEWAE